MDLALSVPGSTPRAVLAQLADGRRLTVEEISTRTGLPRSTVVHALKRLAEVGDVQVHPPSRRGRGRPSRSWSLLIAPGPIAVVIATAHGTVVGVVAADGQVLSALEAEPLDAAGEGRHAGPALEALDRAIADAGVVASDLSMAVVGLPGPSGFGNRQDDGIVVPPSGHLRRFRTWDGGSPADRLAEHLGCPVYTENDANLAALGECDFGAGIDLHTVLHVSLTHGTGAGLVIGGVLHRGRSGLAGEIGHLHTDDSGALCHCGARGCFWRGRSIPALLAALAEVHGRAFTVADVAAAAVADDADVVRALLGFGHALGRHLADAVVFIDPDALILDGSLGAASEVIAAGVREAVERYAPPTMARGVEVRVGACGDTAPLAGAAALARVERLFTAGRSAAALPLRQS